MNSTKIAPIPQKAPPKYQFWQALFMAFYSSDLYVDVAKSWRGLSFTYLLFMVTCFSIPLSSRLFVELNQYADEVVFEPLKALPPLNIENGEVIFEHLMPYTISNAKGEVIAVVDTTGRTVDVNSGAYPHLIWLITNNMIHLKIPALLLFKQKDNVNNKTLKNVHLEPIPSGLTGVFVGKEWLTSTHLEMKVKAAFCLIYPSVILFFVMLIFSLLFAFAWLGQFVAHVIFKYDLSYQASFRLVMVALTPPIGIYFGLLAVDRLYENTGLAYIALLAFYFSLAILALKRVDKAIVLA